VPDQKPPRLASDERETLLALLQYQRDSLVKKVDGLDDDDARRRFVDSDTTLLWLINHLAVAETLWILIRFAGEDAGLPAASDTLAGAVDEYRRTWKRVDDIVAATPTLDAPCRGLAADEPPANLRWVLMHLLEETARHAGHADILRELIDSTTGR
jgi:uncharacterized protein DUF664